MRRRLSTAGMSERGSSQMTGMRSGYLAGRGGCRAGDERVGQRAREIGGAGQEEGGSGGGPRRAMGEKGRHRPAAGLAHAARARQARMEAQHGGGGGCACMRSLSPTADASASCVRLSKGGPSVGELIRLRHRPTCVRGTLPARQLVHISFSSRGEDPRHGCRSGTALARGRADRARRAAASAGRGCCDVDARRPHPTEPRRARRHLARFQSKRADRRTGRKIYSWRHFSCAHLWNHITAASLRAVVIVPPPTADVVEHYLLCVRLAASLIWVHTKSRPPCGRRTHRTDRRHTTR